MTPFSSSSLFRADSSSSPNRGDVSVFSRPGICVCPFITVSSFFYHSSLNLVAPGGGVAEDFNGPCSDYRPGEDDLQAFDFIRQFRLDVLETKYPGVTKVRGSSRLQTAYRLEKEADLVVPTRSGIKNKLSLLWPSVQILTFK